MRVEREMQRDLPRRLLDEVAAELSAARQPLATYRVQLHKAFGFEAAARIAPYLAQLGITDLYTSPVLQAGPGSMHGYDVVDHGRLNVELGGEQAYDRMAGSLRQSGLGHVLDIVPNHMGLVGDNSLWADLLENGPSAKSARFFDIEWRPVKEELADKVLVPVLGDRYGAVLERGEIQLGLIDGAFRARYFDHLFPINPRSYGHILSYRLEELEVRIGPGEPLDELKSIIFLLAHMPSRHEQDPARQEERRREKEVVKRRVAALCAGSEPVRRHLEENVRLFNGTPGKARSFDLLDKLLDAQAYRLAHWRVSSEEINYRRFFDINSLAAIRMEDEQVFEHAHGVPLRLLEQGKVTGFRVDHPDGLAYPSRYFRLLQEAHILQRAQAIAERRGEKWDELEPAVREQLALDMRRRGPASPFFKPVFVVAEKILGGTEKLPENWAVRGTTGYDFLNQVNGLFVDPAARDLMDRIYSRYIGGRIDFDELVYQKKKLVLYTAMAAEMNLLARQLNRISEANRWTRDFTLYSLRAALIEVIASFPVYRTYISGDGVVDDRDRRYILQAVASAKRKNPVENESIYDFIADILLQKFAAYVAPEERPAQLAFVIKLQQMLGPVMAKGLEDTAFYVYNRLLSLNEVGGEPRQFGVTPQQFHAWNQLRAKSWPRTLLATATHDTKRGEDTRTRIDALSEVPRHWAAALSSWTRRLEPLLREVDGRKAPDRNELMLFFQTLVGVWPNQPPGAQLQLPAREELEQLSHRLQQYMVKAIKEGKVNTSWIQDNKSWEEAVTGFVRDVLALPPKHGFWKSYLNFQRQVAEIGMHDSLAQVVLKVASPGVPDLYQGTELWDFSLVDPDNRRPVDFESRRRVLREIAADDWPRAQLARELYEQWQDGRIKLFLTQAALHARRENPDLFAAGAYQPLEPVGPRADNLVAFSRTAHGQTAVVVVPRLVAELGDGDRVASFVGFAGAGAADVGAPREVLADGGLERPGAVPVEDVDFLGALAQAPVQLLFEGVQRLVDAQAAQVEQGLRGSGWRRARRLGATQLLRGRLAEAGRRAALLSRERHQVGERDLGAHRAHLHQGVVTGHLDDRPLRAQARMPNRGTFAQLGGRGRMRLFARLGALLLRVGLGERALHLDRARHRRSGLELRHQLRHLLPALLDVRDQLRPRSGAHLALHLRQTLPLARRGLALASQILAEPFRLGAGLGQGGALGVEALHRGGQRRGPASQELPGPGAHLGRDADPRRDLDGRAATDLADLQAVGGREPLQVESHARGREARVGEPQRLQLLQMRRDEHLRACRHQLLQRRDRERRSFARVRVRGDLVDEHQRARSRRRQDVLQRGQVRGEGREIAREVPLVADGRVHGPVQRHARPFRRGHRQPRARHERAQPHRRNGHRLSARVGSADDQPSRFARQRDVVRDDLRRAQRQQRMPQREQPEALARPLQELRRGRAQVVRQLGSGAGLVEARQGGHVLLQLRRAPAHCSGQLGEDALLLLQRAGLGDGELVPQLEQLLGLDEQRLPAAARVVHDARQVGLVLGAHRQDVAVAAHRVVRVAQHPHDFLVGEHLLELRLDCPVQAAGALAQLREHCAGGVEQLPRRIEGPLQLGRERLQVAERLGPLRVQRRDLLHREAEAAY